MSKATGCSVGTCGCCDAIQAATPFSTANRPGLPALRYRVGTHGAFLETMLARLATMTVEAPGSDGQTLETFRPLSGLTTRDPGDPAIALLDGWASIADILTFYQERIANEGFLRTAIERRSILELARLVGYSLRPGVAATVFLAYTLEDKQLGPVEIPIGARSQSIPGPGELPQIFETSEKLVARSAWNNLEVRLRRPQDIRLANALTLERIYLAGTTTNLQAGQLLMLVFQDPKTGATTPVIRTATAVDGQFAQERTAVSLQPVPGDVVAAVGPLTTFLEAARPFVSTSPQAARFVGRGDAILRDVHNGLHRPPTGWPAQIQDTEGNPGPPIDVAFASFTSAVASSGGLSALTVELSDPWQFIPLLLVDPIPQARSPLFAERSTGRSLAVGSDAHPQLLLRFAPRLKDSFYTALGNASVNPRTPELTGVYRFGVTAAPFGSAAAKQATYVTDDKEGEIGQLKPPSEWDDWPIAGDESADAMFLDKAYEAILPGSFILMGLDGDTERRVFRTAGVHTGQRAQYGITGPTTQLKLAAAETWWNGQKDTMDTLRATLVRAESVLLELAEEPIAEPLETDQAGSGIELAALYDELTSGRWVILSGERDDIPGVTGVRASELLMISQVVQGFDPARAGDRTHTTLHLETPTAHRYKRETLTIYGNVVKASHGDTHAETLGSGAGSQALQSFELKQPPLTFVAAPTAAGVTTTLAVYVDDVEWSETDTLAASGPADRSFVTKTDDASRTTVIFGDGEHGSRLPTGVENVKSIYRGGIGRPGNVLAEQVSMLVSRPLGVKSVINPLRASGGADREDRDQARENAPIGVMALDRLVSLRDYADFTRTFAGVAKADARRITDGSRQVVHLTIAGADDIPIDAASDLYRNLLEALETAGDPDVALRVQSRELIAAVLSARIAIESDRQWEPVVSNVRAAIYRAFGFAMRALGQPLGLCEIIALVQGVPGVAWLDVDVFGGLPERFTAADGRRQLMTPESLATAAATILEPKKGVPPVVPDHLDVGVAAFDGADFRPAQLAIFTPDVPDTLILNQVPGTRPGRSTIGAT